MTGPSVASPSSFHSPLYRPSKIIEEGDSSSNSSSSIDVDNHLLFFKPLHHQHHSAGGAGGGVVMHDGVRRATLHRQNTPGAVTDSTMFSVTSSSVVHTATAPSSAAGGGGAGSQHRGDNTRRSSDKKKGKSGSSSSGGGRIHKLGKRFTNILKRSSKKRTLSEAQLRKRVRKAAERSDWDAVRKLIANYEFSDIPEAMPKRGSFQPSEQVAIQGEEGGTSRRPSYGTRNGGDGLRRSFTGSRSGDGGLRRSFTGKESAAAAAVIKAAMLDESSGPDDMPGVGGGSSVEQWLDIGENILHDVCRFSPPLDVLETLLTALRNRRGSTFGTDEMGRTPLHLAAACGAPPMIIDALVRTDPTPASIGDNDRRSPLHLAMRYLVNEGLHPLPHHHLRGKHQAHERQLTPQEIIEQTLKIVQILKGAMLTYPGRIDFKDEDKTGYSPLDYAIDEGIDNQTLLQTLIRRKEPRRRRSIARAQGMTSQYSFRSAASACNRSVHSSASSFTEDQDFEILEQLEQDEIDARRHRIEKMMSKKKKAKINHALFDVFGIEEQTVAAPAPVAKPETPPEPLKEKASPMKQAPKAVEDDKPPTDKEEEAGDNPQKAQQRLSEDDIYNQHLEAYLEDFMDDFEGCDLEEHLNDDEDGFDIFDDPDLDGPAPLSKVPKGSSIVVTDEAGIRLPLMEIVFEEDDDCVSIVSEVTVPVGAF